MDTRTPRTPTPSGGRPGEASRGNPRGFFDDEPALSTVKVPSDPAQVIVNHASFRVQLSGSASPVAGSAAARAAARSTREDTAAARTQRRAPVVWSGRTQPGDSGATELLQAAVLTGAVEHGAEAAGATTQTLPRVDEDTPRTEPGGGPPTIVGQRGPRPPEAVQPEPLLRGVRPARGAFEESGQDTAEPRRSSAPEGPDPARRQAYYPGHRMNLGVVLLPMRIFLGLISVYAGMGKLCDPVYFDGGERGSMVTWLRKLEPWSIASPLRDFALEHPVGAGLTVAFLQVIVGVLTIFGLWQRLAAAFGTLLSLALLMTVSWSTVPAYDAPDIIYLAAWSPLVIAGAPVYSIDGRLATGAWRKLGPRADIWALRGRVLRRGGVIATVIVGLTLLIGSVLGGAVRSSQQAPVPKPGEQPVNQLPGSPAPKKPGRERPEGGQSTQGPGVPGSQGGGTDTRRSPSPSAPPPQEQQRQSSGPSAPSDRETVQAPQQQTPPSQTRTPDTPPTSGGSSDAAGGTTGSGDDSGSSDSDSGSGEGSSSDGKGGGLGGLLG